MLENIIIIMMKNIPKASLEFTGNILESLEFVVLISSVETNLRVSHFIHLIVKVLASPYTDSFCL